MTKWVWRCSDGRRGAREFILADPTGRDRVRLLHRVDGAGRTRSWSWPIDSAGLTDWHDGNAAPGMSEWEAKEWALGRVPALEQLALSAFDAVEEEP